MGYDGSLKFDTSIDGKGFENDFKSFGNKVGTIIKGVALGYTGKTLVDYFIGSNADMEQYLTSFEVMLGSAEKAQALLSDLKTMAAVTPFETSDLANASKTLLAFGENAKDLQGDLQMLGDISQGNGEKFKSLALVFGQIKSAGRLMGQDLLQLVNVGFNPLQVIAAQTGKSMADLKKDMENGKISFEMVAEAMKSATSEGGLFYKSMEKQSQTMTGMLSTLKDNLAEFGREAGDKAFEQVKGSLQSLLDMIDKAAKDGTLDDIAEDVGNALKTLIDVIIDVSKFIYEYRTAIAAGVAAMVAFKAALAVSDLIKSLSVAYGALKMATDAQTASQVANNAAMLANPVGIVIAAIAGLIALIGVAVASIDNAAERTQELQKQAQASKDKIAEMTKELDDTSKKIDEINSKDKLSITDEKDLENLKKQNELLQANIEIEKERQRITAEKAENSAYEQLMGEKGQGLDAFDDLIANYQESEKMLEDFQNQLIEATKKGDTATAEMYQGYIDNLKVTMLAEKEDILNRQVNIAKTMEGVEGLTEQGKELQEQFGKVNTAITGAFNIGGNTQDTIKNAGEYYAENAKQSSARISAEAEKIKTMSDEAFKKQLEDIEGNNTRQLITEEQYYSQKDALLKKYGKDQLKEYDSFYGSLKNFLEKQGKELSDNSEKQAKQEVDVVTDKLKEIKSKYESNYKEILSQQENFTKKLASAEMFGRETVGEKDNVLILTNFKQKFEELEQYQQLLDEIRAKGGNEAFTQQIKDMGVTDAVDFMQTLLKSDDMDNYIKSFEEYNNKASEIAQNEYKDEVQSIKDNFSDEVLNTLGEVPAQAALIGEETARLFSEALINSDALKKLQSIIPINDLNKITSAVSASKADMVNSVAANSSVVRNAALTAPTQQTSSRTVVEVIEIHTTVDLDGKIIGESVTQYQREQGYQQGRAIK